MTVLDLGHIPALDLPPLPVDLQGATYPVSFHHLCPHCAVKAGRAVGGALRGRRLPDAVPRRRPGHGEAGRLMNKTKVNIRRVRSDGEGRCDDCDFRMECTRERARQHAAQRGHTVRFVIEDTTIYTPRTAGSEDHD